jgi:hypothetical protein
VRNSTSALTPALLGADNFDYTGAVVAYDVPTTGTYFIVAAGGQSGSLYRGPGLSAAARLGGDSRNPCRWT